MRGGVSAQGRECARAQGRDRECGGTGVRERKGGIASAGAQACGYADPGRAGMRIRGMRACGRAGSYKNILVGICMV